MKTKVKAKKARLDNSRWFEALDIFKPLRPLYMAVGFAMHKGASRASIIRTFEAAIDAFSVEFVTVGPEDPAVCTEGKADADR